MPQVRTDELRAHVTRARAECRRVVFHRLGEGGGHDPRLGMTLPVGGASAQVLLEQLRAADAASHKGAIEGRLSAGGFLSVLREAGCDVSQDEGDALTMAFGDWQRDIDYPRWWR